jgi:hypothetical protein
MDAGADLLGGPHYDVCSLESKEPGDEGPWPEQKVTIPSPTTGSGRKIEFGSRKTKNIKWSGAEI